MEPSSIIEQVGALSYVGLFGVSLIANVVVPVPEEIVILAVGYGIGRGHFDFLPALLVVIVGTFVVDVAMFWLSRTHNRFVVAFYKKVFSKLFPIDHDFRHIVPNRSFHPPKLI
jgi:membrane protein DedA with SNARE-associated domain